MNEELNPAEEQRPVGEKLQKVLARMNNDVALCRRLLRLFGDHLDGVPQHLHELLEASDHTALYGLAHSLKGEAGTLGIDVIAVAADELCQSIKSGRVEAYSVWTEALVQACEIVQGQMKALADP